MVDIHPREQEVTEYFLTEREALLVITQSKPEKAMAITKEVIDVYLAVGVDLFPVDWHSGSRMQTETGNMQ